MELAINNLAKYNGNKILIAGDMYELGVYSGEEHLRMLRIAEKNGIEHIWVVGSEFAKANDRHRTAEKVFSDTKELIEYLSKNSIEQSIVLLKGSRAMKLEQLLDVL
jgi:UDP-N-acetylmuramoyl-tripeptide--D-alanyl-D-alanine ligase